MTNQHKKKEKLCTSSGRTRNMNISDQIRSLLDKDSHIFEEVVSDLCCPITRELPIEPITAADGRVYERYAIEAHILEATTTGRQLRSPVTNENMSEILIPVNIIKNTIQIFVDCGIVEKERGREWTNMVGIKKKADNGDANAMYSFACFLEQSGIILAAATWYLKGAALDNTLCMACLGSSLVHLNGYCMHESTMYLGVAADRGSDVGAYWLGKAFFHGKIGPFLISRSNHTAIDGCHASQASKWLKKFVEGRCDIKHFTDEGSRKRALSDANHMVAMIHCKKCKAVIDRCICKQAEFIIQTNSPNQDQGDDAGILVSNHRPQMSFYSPNTRTHDRDMEIVD